MADRLGQNPDLSVVFYKILQGIYLLMCEKKAEGPSIRMSTAAKADQMVITLNYKTGHGTTLETITKRNKYMARVHQVLPGISDILTKVGKFCDSVENIKMSQTVDRRKIILQGQVKE